ncbi:MAG: hypothetical protein NUV83_00305 [Candidatus Wolfebacteria bacterium]|nr:hypothetical protein [Candidatus Wolfebacteria bacterium]
MDFSSKDYLPNSKERLDRLRKIINKRPVAILAAGPSIAELEKRIEELKNVDICYFGMNNYSVAENHILGKIGKRFSLILNSSREGMPEYIKGSIDFLERGDNNVLASSFYRGTFDLMGKDFKLKDFLKKYDKKLFFFGLSEAKDVPNEQKPLHFMVSNSLLAAVHIALVGGASKVVIFGGDGYSDKNIYYYRQGELTPSPRQDLINDTNKYFNPVAPISVKNIYKIYNLKPIDILICSEISFYNPFPKVSYDSAFKFLRSGKKFDGKFDLRTPKISVISPFMGDESLDKLVKTIESVSEQGYTNFEHIVVCGKKSEGIKEISKKFPKLKLVFSQDEDYFKLFLKGVSESREGYIFNARPGGEYLDEDWFNKCAEVLENRSDISLVWKDRGQIRLAPPRGKIFTYYLLKKKNVLPEKDTCFRKSIFKAILELSPPYKSNKILLLFFNVVFWLKSIIPLKLQTMIFEKAPYYWRKHRWSIFKSAFVKAYNKLKKL